MNYSRGFNFSFLLFFGSIFAIVFFLLIFSTNTFASSPSRIITTEVFVGICGDGIVYPGQECDYGEELNIGGYSITIAGRSCNPDCTWGPYCGDSIVQPEHGEECDDGTNTDEGFCTADCKALPPISPPPGGAGGGGGSFVPGADEPVPDTFVTVEGKAYPNSNVNILKDGNVIGVVSSDSQANFYFTTSGVTPGATTFGFWAEDRLGLRSISYTVTFEVSEGASTIVSGVFIPPTIDMEETVINPGDTVRVFGTSIPGVNVETHIHSDVKLVRRTDSGEDGQWSFELDTSPLEIGQHTARSLFKFEEEGMMLESSFSRAKTFFVGMDAPDTDLTADLNRDGRVNLADFSILLFHWGTSNPAADINGDGNVGLADFSIMLFQWTG